MHFPLTNAEQKVKVCRAGFQFLKQKGLTAAWRLHSAGYAVLQFAQNGKIKTYYMHKLLADAFVKKPESSQRLFVRMVNGNKLDCRLENLEWVTMNDLRRQQTMHNESAYRGVSKDGEKFRAVLYDQGRRVYLGLYVSAKEAALAYDRESFRRFGYTQSLNFKETYRPTNTENSPK